MRKPVFGVSSRVDTDRAVRPQRVDRGCKCMFYGDEVIVVVLDVWFYVPPNVKRRWDLDLRFHPKDWNVRYGLKTLG